MSQLSMLINSIFPMIDKETAKVLGYHYHLTPKVWFSGLSGSGKSTIANAVEAELLKRGRKTYLLDGDNLRHGLNKDLGFSEIERVKNIKRNCHFLFFNKSLCQTENCQFKSDNIELILSDGMQTKRLRRIDFFSVTLGNL